MAPIVWLIVGIIGGVAVVSFWDEIQEWATSVLNRILCRIQRAFEVTSDALVYLASQGTRYYQRIKVYVRNIYTNITRVESEQKEIARYDIPEDIRLSLDQRQQEMLVLQQQI
jgi:hypothetical protein